MPEPPILCRASVEIDDAGLPLEKYRQLMEASKFMTRLQCGDTVAIKLHVGEFGNVRYLQLVWARTLDATKAALSVFASEKTFHAAIGTDFTAGCDCVAWACR